jgi:hypothetical protein
MVTTVVAEMITVETMAVAVIQAIIPGKIGPSFSSMLPLDFTMNQVGLLCSASWYMCLVHLVSQIYFILIVILITSGTQAL